MTKIDKTTSGIVTTLFLASMALGMSAGCSSSEEDSSSSPEDCNCSQYPEDSIDHFNCMDRCTGAGG